MKRRILPLGYLLIAVGSLTSCAYRLTNLHIVPPLGIRSIAIEAVYDTSGEVLPHEHLWSELQRAFSANGHLKVTSVATADALVRAHVRAGSFGMSGGLPKDADEQKKRKDPELFVGAAEPPGPGLLPDLTRSKVYYSADYTSFKVDIEVWDLRKKVMMLQRTYPGAIGATIARETASPEFSDFIRHEEAVDRGMASVARAISETLVTDMLVR